MKTATIPYILTVCYLIRLFEAAIISSNKVDINDIPHCTTKLYQLLFGAYNALDADGEILFDYGDNEVYAISKIANGKQNVGRKYRNLILYGECGDISIEPIFPEKIQYIFDNYMTRSEVVHILKTIKEVLIYDTVIANPVLIEAEATVSEYIPTSEIRCKQSEIDRAIDNGTKTAEEIRNDILRLAELKYKHCTYSDVPQKTELLKSLISDKVQLNSIDIGLLRSCVKRITVSHSCVIEAEFINGVIIKNETERSDDNGSGSKCKDNPCQATSN